jgi:hypothetical protein
MSGMRVTAEKLTSPQVMLDACNLTRKPGMAPSKMTLRRIYQCEHSPARTQIFWIVMEGIPTFVSVHLVRHKIGVEHFVESNRDDRGGVEADRMTPVNHGMLINAVALMAMARKRLCFQAHPKTVAVMRRVRAAIQAVDPDLAEQMRPECCYRNRFCPELRECKPGLYNTLAAYGTPRMLFEPKIGPEGRDDQH